MIGSGKKRKTSTDKTLAEVAARARADSIKRIGRTNRLGYSGPAVGDDINKPVDLMSRTADGMDNFRLINPASGSAMVRENPDSAGDEGNPAGLDHDREAEGAEFQHQTPSDKFDARNPGVKAYGSKYGAGDAGVEREEAERRQAAQSPGGGVAGTSARKPKPAWYRQVSN